MKLLIIIGIIGLLLAGSVSAMTIDYYYHPECGHCQKIHPFMQQVVNKYSNIEWNIFDTSITPFNEGTPTLFIDTDDDRRIKMVGSYEIPRYLECEINQQSNLNCLTYSADYSAGESWFIKE